MNRTIVTLNFSPIKKLLFIALFLFTIFCQSQTKIAPIFNDHMVLQCNTEVQIWGKDSPKTTIEITGSWGAKINTKTDKNGKWKTTLKTKKAGGPYTLTVKGTETIILKNILLGEVWLCGGQSNMAMALKGGPGQHIEGSNKAILKSKNSNIRFFTVPDTVSSTPLDNCKGTWKLSNPETSANFSAVAYSFGKMLHEHLNVPIGLISSNVGGTPAQAWTSKEIITSEFPEFTKDLKKEYNTKTATSLYNGMINPLIPFTIKGTIWYQGEGNRWNPEQYSRLFPAMIKNWRDKWKQGDFPFYFVQLAPFGNNIDGWVGIQLAQLKTMLTVPNTGMAVINDIGYKTRIHPPKKIQVGERLAYWALAKDYNVTGIVHSGPVYKSMKIEASKIVLQFKEAPLGITSLGKPLNNFEVAGEDGIFYSAEAKIIEKGKKLEVWSDSVINPKNVRYAWKSYVEGSLFNTAGLPASAFSTQNWEEVFKK
ncbi:sialate O-acetylesterase [Maribacter vaceletii]|uniref:Sialate O-acetylesterase n=1 Tax=Maribacter vaceletii TaxID=1206816 RepID=A0A495ECL0_9FLAO|nr:sialate O-acetylesterase [Maribacter vaceletii]RKR14369.1 sialate O-acetylesterase [Maribacter vaceletii]